MRSITFLLLGGFVSGKTSNGADQQQTLWWAGCPSVIVGREVWKSKHFISGERDK